jgi:hypothetical protein
LANGKYSVDIGATENWCENMGSMLQQFAPQNLLIGEETGLFSNVQHNRTVAVREENMPWMKEVQG